MRAVDLTTTADDGLSLAGTLTLPDGPGPHPAVLLLHGSGPLDRDANTKRVRMNLGAPLAAALAAKGIASLRYDRRGTGATPGNWRAAGFTDNRQDAEAALRTLSNHADIRADAIGVVGHSEGAVHAMSLGTHPQVRAVVLLAGFARVGEDALRWQAGMIARDLPKFVLPALRTLATRQLNRIKKSSKDVARVAGLPINARWTREMLTHDSRPALANIKAPVLAITGAKDVQVDPADLDVIHQLVPGEVEIHCPADLTHVLRRDPGQPSMRSYRRLLQDPVDATLLAHVTGWLSHRLPAISHEKMM